MDPVDPELLAELRSRAKLALRRRMRSLRGSMPETARAARSEAIAKRLSELPALREARNVALFWPLVERGEVDLRPLDALLRGQGKRLWYPFMEPNEEGFETGFRHSTSPDELVERGRRFAEPPAAEPRARSGDIELVVVPALAVAPDGHRLGYGAGFYDVTLPEFCPPAVSVAVAYGFQLLAELPSEDTDFRCDWVLTDEHSLESRARR